MQTITVFLVITALVAVVSFGLARFYSKVSSEARDSHWITRTSIIGFVIAVLVSLSTVATLLALTLNFYDVAYIPLNVAKASLLLQLVMTAMLFAIPATRHAALTSTLGKVLVVLLSFVAFMLSLAFKLLRGMFKLSAKSQRNRGIEDGAARPWTYHGYEGYVERSERIRGKLF